MSNNIMGNSSVFGATGTDNISALAGTDRLTSDKHTFLKLLVAQLTHQDPLNPTEDKEFITQLAQFTSLEQLQEINSGVETLNTTMNQAQLMTATGFLDKDIVATGNQVTKANIAGQILTTTVWYTIEEPMAKGQANVYDGNNNLVYSEELGPHQAGSDTFPWSGRDMVGNEVPEGVYTVIISAQDENDKTVMVKQQITARVRGVVNESGVYKLVLDGGRVVPITDVTEVVKPDESSGAVATYSGRAADAAAAASLAADEATANLQKTIDATDAADANRTALVAIKAAEAAKTSATTARKAADNARKDAEHFKTAEALEESRKAGASADAAEEYAETAAEAAKEAKKWAEDKFDVSFD